MGDQRGRVNPIGPMPARRLAIEDLLLEALYFRVGVESEFVPENVTVTMEGFQCFPTP
jgi:hypothetical protein